MKLHEVIEDRIRGGDYVRFLPPHFHAGVTGHVQWASEEDDSLMIFIPPTMHIPAQQNEVERVK